ncbi:MAG TPA: oxygenase MpaB family protein [Allosphingosinicella sp.]|jgi:uncharacterized protein (DUF2236 family)
MRRPSGQSDSITLPGVRAALRDAKALISRSVETLSPDDPGHFGPGSVSWRIFSNASYGISGIAAVLVQALHPVAMAAVDRYSAFRTDAWRRARMTADYVFAITFSGRATADSAAERVRAIHRSIGVDDPELLLWVHAVHTDCALRGYEAFVRRLSEADRDRFVAEQVVAAELVGLGRADVPGTYSELRSYLDSVPGLGVTEPARDFARLLLGARMPPAMRPFWALHVVGAASLLPAAPRRDYGLPGALPTGRLARALVAAAIGAIDRGYRLFRPVREARRRLRDVERARLGSAFKGG